MRQISISLQTKLFLRNVDIVQNGSFQIHATIDQSSRSL